MLVEFKDISAVRKAVEVEIPADAIRGTFGEVAREFVQNARIPGFRKGKAPKSLVQKKFSRDIQDEVLERLLPKFFHEAIEGRDVEPLGDPSLKDVGELSEGAPLKFTAEFEVKPTFELGVYKGLEVTERRVEVSDDEIDIVIERVRMQSSNLRPIEDRAAEPGDYLVVDIKTSGEDVESRSTEDYELQLGPEAPLPELVDVLCGKRPGDEATFEKKWEADAPNEEVAGKTVRYDIRLKAIRVLDKPAIDDELAKGAGLESLAALKEAIRKDLWHQKEHEVEGETRKELTESLTSSHEFELPEIILENELRSAMRSYARYLSSQGIDVEKVEIDWAGVRERMRPEAEARGRCALILEKVARAEKLEVGNAEIDAEIRKLSEGAEFAEVKQRLRRDGTYDAIRHSLLEEKAMKLIMAESKPVPAKD